MRLHAPLLAALALSSAALAAAPSQPAIKERPRNTVAASLRAQYLAGLFRAKPHLATYMGVHTHDGALPDLSDAALKRREQELVAQQKTLAGIDKSQLSVDELIDGNIIADGIELELLELREIRSWTWNPRLHDQFPYYDPREIVASRLSDIIHGSFGTEADRRKAVTSQLIALPRFLQQQKAALKQPSKIHLDQAIKDNKGRIEFFETEVKAFTHKDVPAEKARVAAVAALRDYQAFMEKTLPARATRDWKLGAELYAKKFPLALQTDLKPEELAARADKAFRAAREELYQVSLRLHGKLWPREQVARSEAPADQAKLIAKVRDEISKDHPKADVLVQAHAARLDALRAFIEKNDLLPLPPKETLSVEPMPEFKRGSAGAEYLSPGMLDPNVQWRGTYYVDPVDPTWPPEKVESYLRANNDYSVELTAAHEAYPGHHTQAWYSRKELNPLRATLWNGPFAEGWAVYGEELLTRMGYGGERNDRYLFNRLKGAMVVAANARLDIGLQSGQMTDEQAVKFMVEEGFQEQAQAEKKLLRAKLDSTQLSQYFIGYSELVELDAAVKKRESPGFSQRKLNEALVGHGTIAVKYLRLYVLTQPKP
ncbi:MAG TPA: DUF885 domain-containing protein [Myxococcaceae bacterium]|nr:DUF885 domain-containing protein [Myxococcaceae bacterium]